MTTYQQILKSLVHILGDGTTVNTDLNIVGKALIPNFLGVYSSDNRPKTRIGQSYIYNDMPSNEPGRHWLAIINVDGREYLYDSYNRDLDSRPDIGNGIPDQKGREANCGQRSLAALILVNLRGVESMRGV